MTIYHQNGNSSLGSERKQCIEHLISLGLPPLPVAPVQDKYQHYKTSKGSGSQGTHCPLASDLSPLPLFTGKNPSYLDKKGIPHLVNHRKYQNTLPSRRERKKWFANSANGIGTLGGWGDVVWIDLDAKQFASGEECNSTFMGLLEKHPTLAQTWLEQTHSGGYRIAVKVTNPPEFTNFALEPGGKHVGEALGAGRFTVLAPTVGPSGNSYQLISDRQIVEVESLESIGIYPVKSNKPHSNTTTQPPRTMSNEPTYRTPGALPLELLGTDTSREVLFGADPKQDRSASITGSIKEWAGWYNWCSQNRISVFGTPEELAYSAGRSLGIDEDRIGRILAGIDLNSCEPSALYKGDDLSCWKKIKRLDTVVFERFCPPAVKQQLRNTSQAVGQQTSHRNGSNQPAVTGDSDTSGDSGNTRQLDVIGTSVTVTDILERGLSSYEEVHELEQVQLQSVLSKKAFWELVTSCRSSLDEVLPEDEQRLNDLIEWSHATVDFEQVLPSMAQPLQHDAKILNIDPMALWQYLFPAVLSLAGGKVHLDLGSHTIPAIAWTGIIGESGVGKTRAEKLILKALRKKQVKAKERYLAEHKQWKEQRSKEDTEQLPEPVERKYLFEISTIQAVMKRLGEQREGDGSLWARDELAGLFKSLGQFSRKGEHEGLEVLLKTWDGDLAVVDRVAQTDSYIAKTARLSLVGGIQPLIFRRIFQDPEDAQGIQARFLFAHLEAKAPKLIKGHCQLSEILPHLYEWLEHCPTGGIALSAAAHRYYTKLYEKIGRQTLNTSLPAIRAWMFKLPTNILRIAFALHLIECCFDRNRNFWELQRDTLERAMILARYYRSSFQVIQEKAVDTSNISSILLKVWDLAVTKQVEGISPRDAYRAIKGIQHCAKEAGRKVRDYTLDLFRKLAQMGKGMVVSEGRRFKFVANFNPNPPSPPDGEKKQGSGYLGEWENSILNTCVFNTNTAAVASVLPVAMPSLAAPVVVAQEYSNVGDGLLNTVPNSQTSKLPNFPISQLNFTTTGDSDTTAETVAAPLVDVSPPAVPSPVTEQLEPPPQGEEIPENVEALPLVDSQSSTQNLCPETGSAITQPPPELHSQIQQVQSPTPVTNTSSEAEMLAVESSSLSEPTDTEAPGAVTDQGERVYEEQAITAEEQQQEEENDGAPPFPQVGEQVLRVRTEVRRKGIGWKLVELKKKVVCTVTEIIGMDARTDNGFNISHYAWERGFFVPFPTPNG